MKEPGATVAALALVTIKLLLFSPNYYASPALVAIKLLGAKLLNKKLTPKLSFKQLKMMHRDVPKLASNGHLWSLALPTVTAKKKKTRKFSRHSWQSKKSSILPTLGLAFARNYAHLSHKLNCILLRLNMPCHANLPK